MRMVHVCCTGVIDMFKDIVTIFNMHEGKWQPTVISNTELQTSYGENESVDGNKSEDKALLIIHMDNELSEKFRKPLAYENADDKSEVFTIRESDFFALGEFNIAAEDSDYEEGYFAYMRAHYDDVYKITSCNFYKTIPHIEIKGR